LQKCIIISVIYALYKLCPWFIFIIIRLSWICVKSSTVVDDVYCQSTLLYYSRCCPVANTVTVSIICTKTVRELDNTWLFRATREVFMTQFASWTFQGEAFCHLYERFLTFFREVKSRQKIWVKRCTFLGDLRGRTWKMGTRDDMTVCSYGVEECLAILKY